MFQGQHGCGCNVLPARHRGSPRFRLVRSEAIWQQHIQGGKAPGKKVSVDLKPEQIRTKPMELFREAKQAVDLTQAPIIVAVGRGIKAPENIALAEKLRKAPSAENSAASRPICDEGWLPMDRQIGSSGQTVAPKLYLALGISGAIQHVVGMKGSRTIARDEQRPQCSRFSKWRITEWWATIFELFRR